MLVKEAQGSIEGSFYQQTGKKRCLVQITQLILMTAGAQEEEGTKASVEGRFIVFWSLSWQICGPPLTSLYS